MKARCECGRCGKQVKARRVDGMPVAHKCPHGKQCVRPAWSKAPLAPCYPCNGLQEPVILECDGCHRKMQLGAVYMPTELIPSLFIEQLTVGHPFYCPSCCSSDGDVTKRANEVSLNPSVTWKTPRVSSGLAVAFKGSPNVSTIIVEENGFLNVRIESKP